MRSAVRGPTLSATGLKGRDATSEHVCMPTAPRVLVVDDEPLLRQRLVEALEDEGIEVAGQAGNGEDALAQVMGFRPDVVLVDVRMPGMGGIAAIPQIHAIQPGAQVVMVSAYDDDGLQEQARAAGAAGYFVKGGSLDMLVALVRSAAQ